MKKRTAKFKLSLHRETLQSLELPRVRGAGASFHDTQCDACNSAYSVCIYIACHPGP